MQRDVHGKEENLHGCWQVHKIGHRVKRTQCIGGNFARHQHTGLLSSVSMLRLSPFWRSKTCPAPLRACAGKYHQTVSLLPSRNVDKHIPLMSLSPLHISRKSRSTNTRHRTARTHQQLQRHPSCPRHDPQSPHDSCQSQEMTAAAAAGAASAAAAAAAVPAVLWQQVWQAWTWGGEPPSTSCPDLPG